MVAASTKLKAFNGAFGISYKRTKKGENTLKFVCSLPIIAIISAIRFRNSKNIVPDSGKLLLARGILCGLVVGMPIVLALDIIASLSTQIHQARKTQRRIIRVG